MRGQADLFEHPRPPTIRRVKRAHVVDAGDGMPGYPFGAQFECKCGWRSGWLCFDNEPEIRRGVPCEVCNNGGSTP